MNRHDSKDAKDIKDGKDAKETKWNFIIVLSSFACLSSVARADFDALIDSPMYRKPDLPTVRVVMKFPEEALALWSRALEGPDTELKCRAAQAILEASHRGVKGLEAAIPHLIAACDKAEQPRIVRLAVARALVAVEARQAAASLLRQAQAGDSELRTAIEPALARWDYRPARAMWLARLREPTTPHRTLVLAIRGLAAVGEKEAADRLRDIVLDKQAGGPIRVEAAQGLGQLRTEGLHPDAERLTAEAAPRAIVPRLAAAALLRRHRDAEAVRLLQKLARDTEPAVAAVAVARLLEIDPELLVPNLEELRANPDAVLRSLAVDVLRRLPTAEHLKLLGERLDDTDIDVRRKARRYMLELARETKWHKQVITEATTVLQGEGWRGLEQATLLLTQLDHKEAAGRFVELLREDRPEVKVTAAWGLRKLDVPETLPEVVRFIEEDLKRPHSTKPPRPDEFDSNDIRDHTLSQLHQFLGQRKYRPADALLRRFIPKFAFGYIGESRAAAIWALGMIHEGKMDDALAAALEGRLRDNTLPPEDFRIRWMSAIGLGRMKAKGAVDSLRLMCPLFKPTGDPLGNACGWAIEQITGQKMPPPEDSIRYQNQWFLVPDK